jgi:hypothetical protein
MAGRSFPAARSIRARRAPRRAARSRQEIGLEAALIEPIGYLDLYRPSRASVSFPGGARHPGYALRINASEVADAFECRSF